ncbi:MAG: hypothetical protein ACYCP0_04085 [Acidiferrobacteraceae bacterium]
MSDSLWSKHTSAVIIAGLSTEGVLYPLLMPILMMRRGGFPGIAETAMRIMSLGAMALMILTDRASSTGFKHGQGGRR